MISIIVPIYNSEKTLQRCIESILAQTYQDIDVLLVIDGATDASCEIAKRYEEKDSRIRIIEKENEGVSKARNLGILNARGEYIQFVDSDDYMERHMCERLIQIVDKQDVQMVLCGYHHLFLNRDIKKLPQKGTYELDKNPEVFLSLYEQGYLNMPWNKLFKKELIKEPFDETLSLGEDLLFNLSYMKKVQRIGVLSEALYYYIQENSQDTLSSQKRKDKYKIAVKICEEVKNSYARLLNANETSINKTKIQKGNQIIYKRLILEFLDEIEGFAYDKSMNRTQKLSRIDGYMKDTYLQKANQNIENLQIDYRIINFFFKRKKKYIIYFLIYIRKWCLFCLRRLQS